jgi:hypothetical protein
MHSGLEKEISKLGLAVEKKRTFFASLKYPLVLPKL